MSEQIELQGVAQQGETIIAESQIPHKQSLFQIDYKKLLFTLLANWMIIALCLVAGCGLGFIYSRFFVKRQYQAVASFFTADTQSISIGNVSVGTNLGGDFVEVILSPDTLKEIISDMGLDINYLQLKGMLSIVQKDSTHIMYVTATAGDPDLAVSIANTTVNVGKKRIYEVISGSSLSTMQLASRDTVIETTPSRIKYIRYGALMGLIIPVAIFFLMVMLDNTLSDEEEVKKKLQLPIMGTIPYYGEKNIMKDDLGFFEREAFNTFCGNIELSGYEIKTIAITSSVPNEGKSSISYRTALVLTEFGKKVLYVDCDMRNSTYCKQFNIDQSKVLGLSEYLSRNLSLSEVIIKTGQDNLDVITSGKYPPNPSALLSSDRFKTLTGKLAEFYDYVILDTPPLSAVIDGVFVAKECDGCIILVEEGVTDTKRAMKTRDDLLEAETNILGVVVNKVNRKGNAYGRMKYGKYGKYGLYGRYGRYGKKYGYGYGYGYGKGYGHSPEDNKKLKKKKVKSKKDEQAVQPEEAIAQEATQAPVEATVTSSGLYDEMPVDQVNSEDVNQTENINLSDDDDLDWNIDLTEDDNLDWDLDLSEADDLAEE